MWKLFEKTFGKTETEEPARDSEFRKEDSEARRRDFGVQAADSGAAARDVGSGNGGANSRVAESQVAAEGKATEEVSEMSSGTVASPAQPAAGLETADLAELEGKIKAAMRTVYDPEIPINICELGLVYGLQIEPGGKVRVQMTLTAPSCPEAQTLPARVQYVIQEVPGVSEATVELVWEPTWTPQKMSEAARLQLGIF
jgi:FeS assembly SUF system protein